MKIHGAFLSPIHDYTDSAFRALCRSHGALFTCIPLVNAIGVVSNSALLERIDVEGIRGCEGLQIVGDDPGVARQAIEKIAQRFPSLDWFDLNCGCPSARTMESGGGGALLSRPDAIPPMIEAMEEAGARIVSAKIRLLPRLEDTIALARGIERAGADLLIVHGRTRSQGYGGSADWGAIKAVHEAIDIPLVGNGDIASRSDGLAKVESGHCDAFMVGRAAMGNPLLFEDREPEGAEGRTAILREYLVLCRERGYGDTLKRLKAKAMNVMKGVPGGAKMRASLFLARDEEELLSGLEGR